MSISDGCPVCEGKTFTTKEVVVDVGAPGEPSHRGRVPLYTGACSECERVRGLIEAEREACAEIRNGVAPQWRDHSDAPTESSKRAFKMGWLAACSQYQDRIRERGKQ